jgi:hypothetical protein
MPREIDHFSLRLGQVFGIIRYLARRLASVQAEIDRSKAAIKAGIPHPRERARGRTA